MTNQQDLEALSPEERQRMRRQLGEQAVRFAVNSRWSEAASANREYLRLFGDEPEALNRLGKALTELGQISDARSAYGRAIEIDATNSIARRNLDRLAGMKDSEVATAAPSQVDPKLFVEETARTAVARLQAVNAAVSALLDAGDLVDLRVSGNAVNVHTVQGEYVGMVAPRIGLRLARMIAGGNRYAAAIVSIAGDDLRVVIRETFQHPSLAGRISFPQARAPEVRAYMPKGLRRKPLEDFAFLDEDEEEAEETEEGWSETEDDLQEHGPGINIETEDESFD